MKYSKERHSQQTLTLKSSCLSFAVNKITFKIINILFYLFCTAMSHTCTCLIHYDYVNDCHKIERLEQKDS